MNGKIFLLLFILFYHKEIKAKKTSHNHQNDGLFASEDLLLFVEETTPPWHHRDKRDVTDTTMEALQETGSGSPETTFTTFMTTSSSSSSSTTTSQETTTITSTPLFINETTTTTTMATSTTTTTTQNTRIVTSTSTSPAITSTSTTLPPPSKLIYGPTDQSLFYYWQSNFVARKSFAIYPGDIDLNVMGMIRPFFRVHPNGLVTFPSNKSNIILNDPQGSILSFKVPIIAPLWSPSILTTSSDIKFGQYTQKTLSADTVERIKHLITNSSVMRLMTEVTVDSFVPEMVFIITWERIQLTRDNANDIGSFQLILATSVTQRKTYAVFNYESLTVANTSRMPNMFIGYTDGNSLFQQNMYTHINGIDTNDPTEVAAQYGNTNSAGVWVYDLGYQEPDACTVWYQSTYVSLEFEPLMPNNHSFVPCSSDLTGAQFNPTFQEYTNPFWGSQNSTCYKLISPVQNYIQQFCCYDITTGALQTSGSSAGFFYQSDNFGDIINHGFLCCYNQDWSLCSLFYKIYPPSILTNDGSGFVSATGGGDPQIATFDQLEYPFNGYGKFVMSRALDATFEIQIGTELFRNVNGSTLTGTFIRSLALASLNAPVVQLDLVDFLAPKPYFVLYLDQSNQVVENFTRNMNFRLDLPCDDDKTRTCVTVLQNRERCQLLLNNGLSVQVRIARVDVSEYESRSWMQLDISLPKSYANTVEGLMGNFNGQASDDLRSRNGDIVPANTTDDKAIYHALSSWRVLPSEGDEDLLVAGVHSSKSGKSAKFAIRSTHDFSPVFFDALEVDATTHSLCNGSRQCIYDTLVTGLLSVGLSSLHESNKHKRVLKIIDNQPPSIQLRNSTIKIDWSEEGKRVMIIADIADQHGVRVSIHAENATSYSADIHMINETHSIVQIEYRVRRGEYPFFKIIASDTQSRTSIAYINGFLICDCNTNDPYNECVYDQVAYRVTPSVSLVACECSEYYSGEFCEFVRDECSVANLCNMVPGAQMKCHSLSLAEQKRTQRGYRCEGECPKPGRYTRNEYNACIDIDECDESNVCPTDAKCVNFMGSYKCDCGPGRTFVNNKCERVDYCRTELNTCDSLCASGEHGPICSCYAGYQLASDGRTCHKSVEFEVCKALGCAHMCTLESGGREAACRCHKGYRLDPTDAKTCLNINECAVNNGGCPDKCVDLPGSFRCECKLGTYYDIASNTCHVCPHLKYGLDCSQTCVLGLNSQRCDPVHGPVCNPGFTGPDCSVHLNSCQDTKLAEHMVCHTRLNQLTEITCESGYTFDNETLGCTIINNCKSHSCPLEAKCVNGFNTFTCVCPQGYTYDPIKRECVDVNECSLASTKCPEFATCSNTEGSYECICDNWFINTNPDDDNKNPKCEDIDECALNISRCLHDTEVCINLAGSYTCECRPGYVYSHVRVGCVHARDLLPTLRTSSSPTNIGVNKNNNNNYNPVANSGLAKSNNQSNQRIGILLVILIPVLVLLVLATFAATVCYCWFRMQANNNNNNNNSATARPIPTKHRGQPITTAGAGATATSTPTPSNIQSRQQTTPSSLMYSHAMPNNYRARMSASMPTTPSDAIHHDLIDLETDLANQHHLHHHLHARFENEHEDRSIYRTNYTAANYQFGNTNHETEDVAAPPATSSSCEYKQIASVAAAAASREFFKSLEEKARSHQRTTIVRPISSAAFASPSSHLQSMLMPAASTSQATNRTESTFSLPIAYYEKTTPYSDFRIDLLDRSYSEQDLGGIMNGAYNANDDDDDDDDLHDIIEAFNPVKIPRPKVNKNPLRIFKFGNKSNDPNT